jgi:hypothetical protein
LKAKSERSGKVGKIIVPGDGSGEVKKDLLDLWDQGEKKLSEHDKRQLEMLEKQNPKAFRSARAMEIRRRLSKLMTEAVADKRLLPNTDIIDFIRDRCREKQLKYEVIRDSKQPSLLHIFAWDPKIERRDLRPWQSPADGAENWTYLGWLEKDTEPTPERDWG